jgi:ABC-2 type transport system ATP-binding protein
MIEICAIEKKFTNSNAVRIESLNFESHKITGILGRNGAGKTTLMRMMLDLLLPDKGEIRINKKNVRLNEEWKKNTACYLDENFLIDYLTPLEFFVFLGEAKGIQKKILLERLTTYDTLLVDEHVLGDKYIRDLSKGNKQKVGVLACLLTEPSLLILDEPFSNLDPTTRAILKKIIKKLAIENSMTVIFSSHDLEDTLELCSRIIIIEKGEVVKDSIDIEVDKNTIKEYFTNFFCH